MAYKKGIPQAPVYTGSPIFNWTRFDLPLDYYKSSMPDSAVILFRPTDKNQPTRSTSITLDQLRFEGELVTTTAPVGVDGNACLFYPNPASGKGIFSLTINSSGVTKIELFTIDGKKLITLVDDIMPRGKKEIPVNLENFDSGVYLYQFTLAGEAGWGKIVLNK